MVPGFLPPVDWRPLFFPGFNAWCLLAIAPTYMAFGVALLLIRKRSTRGVGIALAGAFVTSGWSLLRVPVAWIIENCGLARGPVGAALLSAGFFRILIGTWWAFCWCLLAWELVNLGGQWKTEARCPMCRANLRSDDTKCAGCGTRVQIETVVVAEPALDGQSAS